MQEKVVVHFRDGRLLKGYTSDLSPNKTSFRLTPVDWGGESQSIEVESLKAVFFVKDFAGDADYSEWKHFEVPRLGLQVAVKFTDGEVMVGAQLPFTTDYGFLLFPADRGSNNNKVFVVSAAVTVVERVPE